MRWRRSNSKKRVRRRDNSVERIGSVPSHFPRRNEGERMTLHRTNDEGTLLLRRIERIFDNWIAGEHWKRLRMNRGNQCCCKSIIWTWDLERREEKRSTMEKEKEKEMVFTRAFENTNCFWSNRSIEKEFEMPIRRCNCSLPLWIVLVRDQHESTDSVMWWKTRTISPWLMDLHEGKYTPSLLSIVCSPTFNLFPETFLVEKIFLLLTKSKNFSWRHRLILKRNVAFSFSGGRKSGACRTCAAAFARLSKAWLMATAAACCWWIFVDNASIVSVLMLQSIRRLVVVLEPADDGGEGKISARKFVFVSNRTVRWASSRLTCWRRRTQARRRGQNTV